MKIAEYANLPRQKALIMKRFYVIYCRKSSEAEDRQVASIDSQIGELEPLYQQKKLNVLRTFTESHSAKRPGRIIFNEMINFINKRSDIKGIICWKINRLTRNPVDTGTLQWLLQDGKVDEIVTPHKTYTEIDSDFVMAVEGAQANRFIRDLKEDTLRGLNSKIDKGIAPILAPAGYINDKTKNQGERDILPHPQYFVLMRKVFDLALTGKHSIEDLYRHANDLGIRNNRGDLISRTQMYQIVCNPFYSGKFLYKGELHLGIHQPMLTDSEFDLLQDIINQHSRPRAITHEFSWAGFVKCHLCHSMITGEEHKKKYKNGKTQTFVYAKCVGKNNGCKQPYVRAKDLEDQVEEFLKTIRLSPKFLDLALKILNRDYEKQIQEKKAKLEALRSALDGINKRIDNLIALKISPGNADSSLLTDDEFRTQKNKLLIQQGDLKDLIEKHHQFNNESNDLTLKTFEFTIKAVNKWQYGSIDDKKLILRAIGEEIYLNNGRLEITPRTPFLMIQKALVEPKKNLDGVLQRSNLRQSNIMSVWGD